MMTGWLHHQRCHPGACLPRRNWPGSAGESPIPLAPAFADSWIPGTSPGMTSFRTILVANRGEIACRIMRTAKAMGYRTAAVYSQADAEALHVRLADVAACIGPAEARASYLSIAAIIAAAKTLGADAVHPGYGFLSENAEFARACGEAGLVFIGPSPEAIAAMGNKAAAKRRMLEAGVPCVPGYQGADQSEAVLAREAERIGYPVMVKAAAGGGGRGMRLVKGKKDLASALATARAEAENAFGSAELILEKAVAGSRHVEIQVLADASGHVIHLGERDCSVQRRHQKVLEEAPSPAVDAELRARMGAAAVAAAQAIGYSNAGTVEFLLAADGAFYFLEMNTRLQVEHPVTELVTGLDLVALQIRIAAGEPLPIRQEDVRFVGHAIEARLYAEAPQRGFLPQSGELAAWRPPSGPGIRVDHGLNASQTVSPFYDPLLAKIIAHGATRARGPPSARVCARERHRSWHRHQPRLPLDCLRTPEFAAGEATTEFIAKHFAKPAAPAPDDAALAPGRRVVVRGRRPAAGPRSRAHLVFQRRPRLAPEARGGRENDHTHSHRPGPAPLSYRRRRCVLRAADCLGRRRWPGAVRPRRDKTEAQNSHSPATACISSSAPSISPCARRSTSRPPRRAPRADRTRSCARP